MAQHLGLILRGIRLGWQLTLRDVEARSSVFAQENGSATISASWLSRVESDKHELTISKLIGLAEILGVTPEKLLNLTHPLGVRQDFAERMVGPPNLEHQEGDDRLVVGTSSKQHSGLVDDLPIPDSLVRPRYKRAIIGVGDHTLEPMIPAGSFVLIDTEARTVLPGRIWKHEFQRPIYFLHTDEGYICGWCELSTARDWLTLIPHPLSAAHSRRWPYPGGIEIIGRVIGAANRFSN